MGKEVQMWVALDENDRDVFIEDAIPGRDYKCPCCSGIVHCRAKNSEKVTEHFYHLDKTNCDGGEGALHRYWKNHFINIGETINFPKIGKVLCRNRWIEFLTKDGKYRPDITISTNHPKYKYIVIEIRNTNRKVIEQYIDIWDKYKYPVYEIDVRNLRKDRTNVLDCIHTLYLPEKIDFELEGRRKIIPLYKILKNADNKCLLTYDQFDILNKSLSKVYKIFKNGLDKPIRINLDIIERDLDRTFVDREVFVNFTLPLKKIIKELKNYT